MPVYETVCLRRRLSGSLLKLPRRFWHRRRSSWSLLQVTRWSERLFGTVADCMGVYCMCPDGLGTVANCL
ncbi:hypothetical protein DPMN_129596 [Dreissena polymorpha]|uniref:Uncharacterized protein n=1 Tax=Dreissena polymorpha TaxID=45954 RepID=A0A9D4H1G5_DREPO|nr:hypothetical protein DPMN_075731 [Dreissena polymorpha]KAH3827656.1 hypothetical protein DPMN_129596 [Dreissena polymorpha]